MMKKVITLTKVLIIIFAVSILLATPVAALEMMPHAFYGSVLVDDSPALDGLTVTVAIAGATFRYPVTTSTVNGKYGYVSEFKVPADETDTPAKEGGVNGNTIVFYVDGVEAGTYTFEIGQVSNLNLSITRPAPPPTIGRRSLPDPSTFAMVGSGLAAGLFYIGLSRLRWRLGRRS